MCVGAGWRAGAWARHRFRLLSFLGPLVVQLLVLVVLGRVWVVFLCCSIVVARFESVCVGRAGGLEHGHGTDFLG